MFLHLFWVGKITGLRESHYQWTASESEVNKRLWEVTNDLTITYHKLFYCNQTSLWIRNDQNKQTVVAREYEKADRIIGGNFINHEIGIPLILEDSGIPPPMNGLRMGSLPCIPLPITGRGLLPVLSQELSSRPQVPNAPRRVKVR